MKNYLFLPVGNVRGRLRREPAVNDGYLTEAIAAFKNHNPASHVITSAKKLDWTLVADPTSTRKVLYSEGQDFKDILKLIGGKEKKKDIYVGSLRSTGALEPTLADVTGHDVLFIVGHGSYTSEFISRKHFYEEDGVKYFDVHMISMAVLARMIELSGLKKTHVHVKFNACFGGGSDAAIAFDQTSLEGSAVASRRLAMELGKLGYSQILVGGFNYMTIHQGDSLDLLMHVRQLFSSRKAVTWVRVAAEGPLPRRAMRRPAYAPQQVTFEEDPYRIWYDAAGRMVRWNDPDPPYSCEKFEMLDAEKYPDWAAHQKKIADWEKALRDKRLL